jgi:putative DNA primase/helicase
VFAFGAGANGKSTLLNALARVLGDYARQAPPDLLMRRRDEPHPTGLADLHGARLVLATETAQGRHLDEALVKRLTGGDTIKARQMFTPTSSSSTRPTSSSSPPTIGRDRRHRPRHLATHPPRPVRCRHPRRATGPPPRRQARRRSRRDPAVGARRLHRLATRRGLTEPSAVIAATADYRAEMDVLGEFISDCCVLIEGVSAKAGDLYKCYGQWCEAMGERTLSQRKFGLALSERGLEKYRNNGHWWRGIGLNADPSLDMGPDRTAGQNT